MFHLYVTVVLLCIFLQAQAIEINLLKWHAVSTSWTNCGSTTDPIQLLALTISPDTLHLPGNITLTTKFNVSTTLEAPLRVDIELHRKNWIGLWRRLPCADGFGSCSYDDVCAMSPYQGGVCPPSPDNLPCNCPISQGTYSANNLPVEINGDIPSWLEKGQYKAEIKFSEAGYELGCYEIRTNLS